MPDAHLEGLSRDTSEDFWHAVITAGDGRVYVAEDDFELGGARLSEIAYGWRDLNALLSRVD